MKEELRSLARDAEEAAEFFREKPGCFGLETASDLYLTIARLARIIADQPTPTNPESDLHHG